MKIKDTHSLKNGKAFLEKHHPEELQDVMNAIKALNASSCLTKRSQEKTMKGKLLYSPRDLNEGLKLYLLEKGWAKRAKKGKRKYIEPRHAFGKGRFREMDGIKNKVGLEIQFGKYAFMGYDIFSKMVIFKNLGYIECGIEVVPSKELIRNMSTGVSSFEQLLVDFEHRGEGDIDIPVFVIGLGLTDSEKEEGARLQKLFIKKPREVEKINQMRIYQGVRPGPK